MSRAAKIEAAARAVIEHDDRVNSGGELGVMEGVKVRASLRAALALPAVSVGDRERALVHRGAVALASWRGVRVAALTDAEISLVIEGVNATHPRAPSVEAAVEAEVARIGAAVEAAIEAAGYDIPDASGCDSGDPADYIAAQVALALNAAIDRATEEGAAAEVARRIGHVVGPAGMTDEDAATPLALAAGAYGALTGRAPSVEAAEYERSEDAAESRVVNAYVRGYAAGAEAGREAAAKPEPYWMVERPAATNGYKQAIWARYYENGVCGTFEEWTTDASRATHFGTKSEAERLARRAWHDAFASEHMDMPAPSAPRDHGGGLREWDGLRTLVAAQKAAWVAAELADDGHDPARARLLEQEAADIDDEVSAWTLGHAELLARLGPPPTDGVAAAYERAAKVCDEANERMLRAYRDEHDDEEGSNMRASRYEASAGQSRFLAQEIRKLAAPVSEKERAK